MLELWCRLSIWSLACVAIAFYTFVCSWTCFIDGLEKPLIEVGEWGIKAPAPHMGNMENASAFKPEDDFWNIFPGNSKVMKLQWYGKCSFISTSCTPQIGIIVAQCYLPVPLWCCFCYSPFTVSVSHWFQGALCYPLSPLHPRMYKYYIHTKDTSAKRLAKWYVVTLFLGSLCWLFDRLFCKEISGWPVNPQGHALWHVLMGFNSYFANTFLMFCRAQQRDWAQRLSISWVFSRMLRLTNQKPSER
ncbi:Alkaline ceramidase [Vitis vinifera]|uniref:Alkaline ceramidase n=1 Tax=Vitis vinifera TaxID=29760 RepID=A0A438JGL1_VITVI|nr:Alkaline ceramidase [Vitis vinifera]